MSEAVTDEMVQKASDAWLSDDVGVSSSRMRAALQAALAAAPPSEFEAQLADARSANERNRSQFVELIGGLDTAMQSHAWLMDEGRGPYEWDDDRYRDEFAAASKTLKEHLQPLRDTAKDWTDCPTDWDAVKASRLSVESLIAELDQARAHLAQMREALKFYASTWKNYCGDHGVPIGLEPNERLLNDQGERARRTLTSTETTTTNYCDQIRREVWEEAAKISEAVADDYNHRNNYAQGPQELAFGQQAADRITTALLERAEGE